MSTISKFDEAERGVGISAYASPDAPGFAAVSKARYSDFVVHEVDVDGNIARLESLENNLNEEEDAKKKSQLDAQSSNDGDDKSKKRNAEDTDLQSEEMSTKKPKVEDGTEEAGAKDAEAVAEGTKPKTMSNEEKLSDAEVELTKLVGEEAAKGAISMLSSWEIGSEPNSDAKADKNFTLPFIDDKHKRRAIHHLIRSDLLVPFALADTVDKRVRIWHKRFEKEMPNYGHFVRNDVRGGGHKGRGNNGRYNRQAAWPKDRPNFLRFVLYKENIDTGTAIKELSRLLRSSGGSTSRGKGGRGGRGRGRNDTATVNYAGMKDKRGVTAQFCTVYRGSPRDLLKINGHHSSQGAGCGGSSTRGAPLIKVGNFDYVSDSMGLGSLGGNRFDIVLRNAWTDSSESNGGDRIEATKAALEKAAHAFQDNGFINYFGMQRFGKYYDTHLTGLEVIKGNFEQVITIIMRQKGDESDRYADARRRWEKRFDGIDMSDEAAVLEAEKKSAQSVLRDLGRFMNCEMSLMNALSRRPRDYKRAFQTIAKNMRSMFVHGFQSYLWNRAASHRVEVGGMKNVMVGDLVLIEDKSLKEGGSGTSGLKGKAVIRLTEEDIESGQYKITDVVLPLAGTKIQYPQNSTGKYFDDMLAEVGLSKDDLKKIPDREIALTGDYRRLMCMPSDTTFEVKTYEDPLQPLLQTDLMKLHESSLPSGDSSTKDSTADNDNDEAKANTTPLVGMVVGFTLPPSSYATIALRELMKKPTSSDYQRQLQLSGNWESTIDKTAEKDAVAEPCSKGGEQKML